jgi:hypothetical protein
MVNNSAAIIPYQPPKGHFIIPEIKTRTTLPVLRNSTCSTSLVLYEKRLPRSYFMSGPFINVTIAKEPELVYDLPDEGEYVGYNPQGHLIHHGKKGLRIDAYI